MKESTLHLKEMIFTEKAKLSWDEAHLIGTALHNHFNKTMKIKGISFIVSNNGNYTNLVMNWKTPIDSGHVMSAHALAKKYREILRPFLVIEK